MARRNELGPFEREVLEALIAQPRDAYGISILQAVEDRTGRKVSLGALYTTLERMERKGLIRSWWGEATAVRGGRRKRLYAVQAAGTLALQDDASPARAIRIALPGNAATQGGAG